MKTQFPFTKRLKSTAFICLLLLGNFSGCGSQPDVPDFYKELVPVSGVITFKKQPLAGATVTLVPFGTDAVRAAYGLTDAEGKFSVMTPINGISPAKTKGAVPGTYRVLISKIQMPDGTDIPAELTHADAMQQGAKEILPAKFWREENSVLTTSIQKGTAPLELKFDL
ncbi:hypothetical protein [Planctomicrobium sp. SH527]|uniref:hypothetical protein n=1 Tax=Planctomicrobium sp. SH527 TaxID=3448123 RepID=UPI003F5C3898